MPPRIPYSKNTDTRNQSTKKPAGLHENKLYCTYPPHADVDCNGLTTTMSTFGPILRVDIPIKSKNYAFVVFREEGDAEEALQCSIRRRLNCNTIPITASWAKVDGNAQSPPHNSRN
ncbi:hypothetical protein BT69DRAFT_1134587 [Atractiella rhizophila]|nr:hypothetical protein BT69DRAFT_1134587 [Atractiella rhizophila]